MCEYTMEDFRKVLREELVEERAHNDDKFVKKDGYNKFKTWVIVAFCTLVPISGAATYGGRLYNRRIRKIDATEMALLPQIKFTELK